MTSATWSGEINGSVGFSYDSGYNIASEIVNGSSVSFNRNNDGLLVSAGNLFINRDSASGLVKGTNIGNVMDQWGYNGFGEAASYSASYYGSALLHEDYIRDNLGRITQKTETIQGVTDTYNYGYDQDGRLSDVSKDGIQISHYDYDSNGNRMGYTSASGGIVNGTYDAQDRLVSYGGNSYTYTANGELASVSGPSGVTQYSYDNFGNLITVILPSGERIDYIIDGQNRRVGKKVNGVLVQGFLYENKLRPIAELDGNGNVVSQFVYGTKVNVPDYMIKGGETYRIITDQLGSPRLVVNVSNGTLAQQLTYDEFGNVIQDTNPGFQPFGFAGGLYDHETGLVRFGARDYDPFTGRWTAKDPELFKGGDTNIYGYVLDNPVNQIDPSGKLLLTGGDLPPGISNPLPNSFTNMLDPCPPSGNGGLGNGGEPPNPGTGSGGTTSGGGGNPPPGQDPCNGQPDGTCCGNNCGSPTDTTPCCICVGGKSTYGDTTFTVGNSDNSIFLIDGTATATPSFIHLEDGTAPDDYVWNWTISLYNDFLDPREQSTLNDLCGYPITVTKSTNGSDSPPTFHATVGGDYEMDMTAIYGACSRTHTVTGQILGLNPGQSAVQSDFNNYPLGYIANNYLMCRENNSTYDQFNNLGEPLYGPPHGFGIMQVDPPEECDAIWGWQANVEEGMIMVQLKNYYATSYLDSYADECGAPTQEILAETVSRYNGGVYWICNPIYSNGVITGYEWQQKPFSCNTTDCPGNNMGIDQYPKDHNYGLCVNSGVCYVNDWQAYGCSGPVPGVQTQ